MKKCSYKKAGVDIDKANVFIQNIKPLIKRTYNNQTLGQIGGFGGLFKFDHKKFKEPLLVSSSDGVGTKLKIAIQARKHDTVGIDAVAMNVNDIICTGARPLFFLDYISCGKLKPDVLTQVVSGIVKGCQEAGCVLMGGETAEMPGMYAKDDYDIAGFSVGVVDRKSLIDSTTMNNGDVVIGLSSSGLHSNGFSLVRKVFSIKETKRMALELLKPTRIYVKPILSLLQNKKYTKSKTIRAIAHITGGAFYDKIERVIPSGLAVRIRKASWHVPSIFKLIKAKGNVEESDMYRTFNMGIGMILIVNSGDASGVISDLKKCNQDSFVIGEVVKGEKQVVVV